ncbi:GlsB/YeaQ/YmgE family stress response membrane protein [Myxococcus sp. Y35]|uniref:GlsB/YeaQ/YmgE family stress response membrane protein n=1 Tax=Pseudomyxococcus flavus TaxID=3115648 RepID=UPI003CF03233
MKPSRALSAGLTALVLWGQGAAWAQEPVPSEPAQAPATELTPPPLISAPASTDVPTRPGASGDDAFSLQEADGTGSLDEQALPNQAHARASDPVPRIAVEFVAGTGGGIVAGTLGLLAGYLVGASTVGCDECGIVAGVGGLSGVLVGIPAGTWLGGRLMGGKGTFLGTAGGSLVGWGAMAIGSAVIGADEDNAGVTAALLLLPVVGAVTGYELSSQSRASTPVSKREASRQVQVVPVAGMTEHGARLGLMGRF